MDHRGNTPFHLLLMRQDAREIGIKNKQVLEIMDALFTVVCSREADEYEGRKVNVSHENPLMCGNFICLSPMDLASTAAPAVKAKVYSLRDRLKAYEEADIEARGRRKAERSMARRVVKNSAKANKVAVAVEDSDGTTTATATVGKGFKNSTAVRVQQIIYDFAIVFPTSEREEFQSNFVDFVTADVNGYALLATEPCVLTGDNSKEAKIAEESTSSVRKILRGALGNNVASFSFILIAAKEEFYAHKADEMHMSMYTLEADGRADLRPFDKTKLGQFQPLSSSDRQEILYTELQDRVNVQSLLKREAVKCIIPLHSLEDQKLILKKWVYEDGKYQFPPFGRMKEYVFDSERNKFEALNTIKAYMGAKTAIYYGFFEMYQTWLLAAPVPCGIALAIYQYALDTPDSNLIPLYCIINSVWATIFVEKLKRKEAEILHAWDLLNDVDTIKRPRKEFYGDDTIDFHTMNRLVFFPPAIRTRIQMASKPGFLFLGGMLVGLFVLFDQVFLSLWHHLSFSDVISLSLSHTSLFSLSLTL
jgi:hypothetical protein